jgi:hypothetical protein
MTGKKICHNVCPIRQKRINFLSQAERIGQAIKQLNTFKGFSTAK